MRDKDEYDANVSVSCSVAGYRSAPRRFGDLLVDALCLEHDPLQPFSPEAIALIPVPQPVVAPTAEPCPDDRRCARIACENANPVCVKTSPSKEMRLTFYNESTNYTVVRDFYRGQYRAAHLDANGRKVFHNTSSYVFYPVERDETGAMEILLPLEIYDRFSEVACSYLNHNLFRKNATLAAVIDLEGDCLSVLPRSFYTPILTVLWDNSTSFSFSCALPIWSRYNITAEACQPETFSLEAALEVYTVSEGKQTIPITTWIGINETRSCQGGDFFCREVNHTLIVGSRPSFIRRLPPELIFLKAQAVCKVRGPRQQRYPPATRELRGGGFRLLRHPTTTTTTTTRPTTPDRKEKRKDIKIILPVLFVCMAVVIGGVLVTRYIQYRNNKKRETIQKWHYRKMLDADWSAVDIKGR